MESRVLMSGSDSVWVDLGYPVLTAAAAPQTTVALLPAVQLSREAARPRAAADGTSNTILVAEVHASSGYVNPAAYQIISAGE
jgi:hypothetical protein